MCTLKLFSLTLIYYLHCICYHFVLRYCPFFSRFYIHILWTSVIFKLTYKLEINYIIIIIIILKYPYNGFWCVCYNYVLSSLCLRFNSDLKLTVTIKMLRFSFVLGFVLVLIFFVCLTGHYTTESECQQTRLPMMYSAMQHRSNHSVLYFLNDIL